MKPKQDSEEELAKWAEEICARVQADKRSSTYGLLGSLSDLASAPVRQWIN